MSNDVTRVAPSPYAEALQTTGISRQTAHRYQALANVPSDTFESALRDPEKPTTTGVLAKAEATRSADAPGSRPERRPAAAATRGPSEQKSRP